jgi:hypothetical protein
LQLSAIQATTIPGSGDLWWLAKALAPDATVVVYVNGTTYEAVDDQTFRALVRDARHLLGPIDPVFAGILADAGTSEMLTAAFLGKGPPRSEIEAAAEEAVPGPSTSTISQDVFDADRDAEAMTALRRAYGIAAAAAEAPIRARVASGGLTLEYSGEFAPIVFATGTAEQIRDLAADPSVYGVLASVGTQLTMNTAFDADQTSFPIGQGWDGQSSGGTRVRVAVVEYGNVDWGNSYFSGISSSRRVSYSTTGTLVPEQHPTGVMGTIASQNATDPGVAPDAFYISSGTGGADSTGNKAQDFRILAAVDKAVDPGYGLADVVNLSIVQDKEGSWGIRSLGIRRLHCPFVERPLHDVRRQP